MTRLRLGGWQFTANRTDIGGVLVTLSRPTRSFQIHTQLLKHRPIEKR